MPSAVRRAGRQTCSGGQTLWGRGQTLWSPEQAHLAPSGERCSYWLADAPDGTVGHRGLSRSCHGSVRSGPTADRPPPRHGQPPREAPVAPDGPDRATRRPIVPSDGTMGTGQAGDGWPIVFAVIREHIRAFATIPGALLDRLDETANSVEALTGMSAPPRIVAAIRSASRGGDPAGRARVSGLLTWVADRLSPYRPEPAGWSRAYPAMSPSSRPTRTKASSARSRCSSVWAAVTIVRRRARSMAHRRVDDRGGEDAGLEEPVAEADGGLRVAHDDGRDGRLGRARVEAEARQLRLEATRVGPEPLEQRRRPRA